MGYDMMVQGAPHHEPNTYLRRNIWAMSPTREALRQLGMAFVSQWPDLPDSAHLTAEDFDRDGEPVTDRSKLFLQALERVLAEHGAAEEEGLHGIPVHKLCSNDGWHVTSKEVTDALAAYEHALSSGGSHPEAFGDDVLPFLRTAARYGGFRVY